jgi:glycosyltransferase involved in cell wall biosynthesis
VRILVATDSWFPDVRGGSARVAAETAKRLASRGHEVIVLAPEASGVPAVETESQLTVLRSLPRRVGPKTLSDMVATRWLAQRRGGDFDVLVAHQPTVAWGLAATHKNVPLVLVYHASPVRETLLRSQASPPGPKRLSTRGLAALLGGVERSVGKRAARILVLSDYSRRLVESDHPRLRNRTVVVSGGVDTDAFSPEPGRAAARAALGVAEDDILLVSMRRLEPRLGLETLLQAFRFLPENRKARLVVVGEGSRRQALGALARELGLEDRLSFAGGPNQETLRQWYRAADLFVLPPAPHEGFGLATIEALASGTPAVAAPVGASPEILAPLEPRLLARSAEPADLAEAIAAGLELAGPDLRGAARDYAVSAFAWDHVIGGWEDALTDAAQARSRGAPGD